jgi:hypothetical protein
LLEMLRLNSAFALKLTQVHPPLPHAQELKVQCGGLLGLQLAVDDKKEVDNIAGLVASACHKFGRLDEFPYSRIVQSVVKYQARRQLHQESPP